MKTEWDYTELADKYIKRPSYSDDALDSAFETAGLKKGDSVCDVGAGVGHLTIPMAERGFTVMAVEPNDSMRTSGVKRTVQYPNVKWFEGTGEKTGMPSENFDFVSFGSSFNVCDRKLALEETNRILKSKKWFACLWNHRDLNDPLQKEIEKIIAFHIKDYDYGVRREDQTDFIESSGLFLNIGKIEGKISHSQDTDSVIEAWKSHATLARQAGDKFQVIIEDISCLLRGGDFSERRVLIPYTTSIWIAQKRI